MHAPAAPAVFGLIVPLTGSDPTMPYMLYSSGIMNICWMRLAAAGTLSATLISIGWVFFNLQQSLMKKSDLMDGDQGKSQPERAPSDLHPLRFHMKSLRII